LQSDREKTPKLEKGNSSRNNLLSRSTVDGRLFSPSAMSSRRESLRAKMSKEGEPRYMSPTKSSVSKIQGLATNQGSDITLELRRIHKSDLTTKEQLE
jgi:hypothetical protein